MIKVFDKIDEGLDNVFNGKKKKQSKDADDGQETKPSSTENVYNTSGNDAGTGNNNRSNSKFDFVAGTKVLYSTNFANEAIGDFPVPGTWFQFVVMEQDTDTLIRDIGVRFLETDSENMQVEIGYTLDKDFRGKGYATEALTVIINYLINHLNKHRIIASINPTNTDSIKLIERLGFRKEAHFKESLFFHGEGVDDLTYAILAKEWQNRND